MDVRMYKKSDVFTYRNDVYMAVNVYPSVYGTNYKLDPYTIRQEINIYKIANGIPYFFNKVYNPNGINYFSFCEANNCKIYMSFSEGRRHLYKRLFSNISFAGVTGLFNNYRLFLVLSLYKFVKLSTNTN